MLASLTGLGLSAAAGLNAYIPLLLVGVLARFTDVITLPEPYRWIQSGWALAIVSVLLLAELVLDKVAVVDHVNDAIQTLVRPTVGGVIFAATTAAEQADNSTWMQEHPWVGVLLGVVVAGVVHATKATARPLVNATTVGTGTRWSARPRISPSAGEPDSGLPPILWCSSCFSAGRPGRWSPCPPPAAASRTSLAPSPSRRCGSAARPLRAGSRARVDGPASPIRPSRRSRSAPGGVASG